MDVLLEALGEATFQDDKDLQNHRRGVWLVALMEGLRLARERGGLNWDGKPVVAFCSVIDSNDAPWVERETAKRVNPPELLVTFEAGFAAASAGYEPADTGPGSLQNAFAHLLREG